MTGEDEFHDDNPPSPPPVTPIQQAPHTLSAIKLLILKKDTNGQIRVLPPKIAEETFARERERKARTTLLMSIPEDHLAKFHKMTDAKDMWEAIKSRFCGNDESKKMQKYILKQQFKSFSVSPLKMPIKSFLGLYLLPGPKVFESDIKGSTASSSSTQNVTFVSSESTNNLKRVDEFDLEEIDLKWQVAMISMRLKKFYKKTGRRLQFDAKEPVGFDKTKEEPKDLVTLYGDGVDWTGHAEDEQENFALMAHINSCSNTEMSTRDKSGLGYGNQIHEGVLSYEKEVLESVFDSRSSDVEDSPVNDRFAKVEGMHAVPPPMTGIYMPSKSDFGIDESKFTYGPKQSKTSESDAKIYDTASFSKSKVWSDAPIIEEYESDSDDEYVIEPSKEQEKPSFAFVNIVKHVKTPRETVKEQNTYSPSPKADKRDWNGLMSKKLGLGYGFTKRHALYVVALAILLEIMTFMRKEWLNRHMTGNKAYLVEYQDYNGGPVAFGENIVPIGGLACLIAKATVDESNKWHRRLGHVNFKNLNKLVKGNLVRGLPSKIFQNDHTCVACQKGKQHKASCKAKLVSSISQPLQLLHMDLFGPTSVRSINHKTYCLVITDDFSRCDNGTEFKNKDIIEFYGSKGIKREYSNARTLQQNGVAERKNRTLIEAARTMLADSFLPNTFWAEAVSTACYVLNRVLVTKPQNKTPYELITGKIPIISYIRPFGCHVTILNTIDHLGKFEEKSDEGFLVGYSLNSKAFRVYNLETKRVEENLHINFLENKPNVVGKGPNWLFHLDYLTDSMNYQPVTAENKANKIAGPKEANHSAVKSSKVKNGDEKPNGDTGATRATSTNIVNTVSTPIGTASPSNIFSASGPDLNNNDQDDSQIPALEDIYDNPSDGIFTNASYDDEGAVADFTNLETIVNVSLIPTSTIHSIHPTTQILGDPTLTIEPKKISQALEDKKKRAIGTKWVYRNKKDERGVVVRNKARLDLEELYNLVMQRFESTTPEGVDLVLWGDLRTMFDANTEDELWQNQERWNLKSWNFYENCGVHTLTLEDGMEIHMLVERKYPLTKKTLERMMSLKLIAETASESAYNLLRFIQKQIDENGSYDGSEKDL
ncbi:putative ribonuclease H-like domain-containing protein [Tanacetum coccineum]